MIINEGILDELYLSAGDARTQKAEDYASEGKVNIKKVIYEDQNNFEIRSKVRENENIYDVYIQIVNGEIENLSCTCEDYHSYFRNL